MSEQKIENTRAAAEMKAGEAATVEATLVAADATADLAARVSRLERSLRWWRGSVFLMAAVIVFGGTMGAQKVRDWSKSVAPGNNAEYDVVTAKVLRIISPWGAPVVTLTADATGNGMMAMATGMGDQATMKIGGDRKGRGEIIIVGKNQKHLFTMRADESGVGVLSINNDVGEPVVQIGGGEAGALPLKLRASGGKTLLPLRANTLEPRGNASGSKRADGEAKAGDDGEVGSGGTAGSGESPGGSREAGRDGKAGSGGKASATKGGR